MIFIQTFLYPALTQHSISLIHVFPHLPSFDKKTEFGIIFRLGSRRASKLAWRDMWGLVLVKKGRVHGESFSRSPGFHQWGSPVVLRAEVPLASMEEASCWREWGNGTEEARRRREFCDRFEGYGQVCSCVDPLPIQGLSEGDIRNNQVGTHALAQKTRLVSVEENRR